MAVLNAVELMVCLQFSFITADASAGSPSPTHNKLVATVGLQTSSRIVRQLDRGDNATVRNLVGAKEEQK